MSEHEPQKELIPIGENGMQLTNFDQLWRVATLLQKSGLVATSFKTPEQLMVALLRAIELKLPPLQAIEGMTVINNKVGLMGDLALSMVEGSGLLEDKQVTYTGEGDALSCTISLKRKGRKAQSYSFSVAEAKKAGIHDRSAVWRSYPKRMTYYRALGFGLRDEFSDVLKGVKTIEELQDYPDMIHEVPDYEVSEAKIATNQKKQEELIKTKQPGVKVVEQKKQPIPSPAEALEPAFEEDAQPSTPFAERLAKDYPQHPAAVAAAAEPDDLDMGPASPMPESPPPQEAQTAASQPPGDGVEAPAAAPWKEHVILGVGHVKFHKRKVGELNAAELAIIENQWLPAVREQWDDATDVQRLDAAAFEAAIAHSKIVKPW